MLSILLNFHLQIRALVSHYKILGEWSDNFLLETDQGGLYNIFKYYFNI